MATPTISGICDEHHVVADGESLQISQALAANEDSEHGNQQQISGREPQAAPHPRIWDQPQIAD
jgi:hypothetical protein